MEKCAFGRRRGRHSGDDIGLGGRRMVVPLGLEDFVRPVALARQTIAALVVRDFMC